jgi:hypothetical protein
MPKVVADLGADLGSLCFTYPEKVSGRLHGPEGYAHYDSYRDWLRDEFHFRCAYCLMREAWLRGKRGFQIDHCVPQSQDEKGKLEYDNLVYTCPWCNQTKAGISVADPTAVAYGKALAVNEEGVLEAKNKLGAVLIEGLRLNHVDLIDQRKMVLRIIRLAEERNSVEMVLKLLGYPADLPDLKQKRPPNGNKRADGVFRCCYEQRCRGELKEVY